MNHHPQEIMISESEDSESGSIATVSEVSDDTAGEVVSHSNPSVSCCVKDSSDVHVGTRNQYKAPVTVQKYKVTITNETPKFNFVPNLSVTQASPLLRFLPSETHPGPTENKEPSEDLNCHMSNVKVNKHLHESPRRSVQGLLPKSGDVNTGICAGTVIAVILITSVTVVVYYPGAETSNPSTEGAFRFTVQTSHGNDSVDAGTEYVFWEVKVYATFKPDFQWFGPQGEDLLQAHSRKYLIYGSSYRSESSLMLFSVTIGDAGEYRLHVFNKARPEVKKFINVTLTIKIRKPPDMVPNLAEDELQTGDNITLECTALNPITWSYPRQELDRSNDGESSVHITEVRRQQYYVSTFHVSRADYLDTGFYGCNVNQTSSFFYAITTRRTYVYVRDDQHLLVGKSDSIVLLDVNAFEPVVIPCRTTARDITISLWLTFVPSSSSSTTTTTTTTNNNNNNINSNNITIRHNNRSFKVISYDRKVGHTVEQINQDIAVTCSGERDNRTENILYVLLVFKLPKKHIRGNTVCI
jgi:hypothetical protein